MNTVSFFFNDGDNIVYNDIIDRANTGYPKSIEYNWWSLPHEFQNNIDDVINVNGYLYFFKGSKYLKFDIIEKIIVEGPAEISEGWPGLIGTGAENGIDAATEWPDIHNRTLIKTVLFFKGSDCISYDLEDDTILKKSITTSINGISKYPYFNENIDSFFAWKSNNATYAYIFKDNNYIRYSFVAGSIDKGPAIIQKWWGGVTFQKIQACVSVSDDILSGNSYHCGKADDGQYTFLLPADTKFGLTAYANFAERPQTVHVYVDDQLIDDFSGSGANNTLIGLRTYTSGNGKIRVEVLNENSELKKLNYSYSLFGARTLSVNISTQCEVWDDVPECTIMINTPLT